MKLELRIDWSELDLFGHVNNVAFMKYIQASRVNYWEEIGLMELYKKEKIGAMLLSTTCKFHLPLFYPGNIVIEASMDFIKNTSFGIQHKIKNEKSEIVAEAQDIIVIYDFVRNQKTPFPLEMRELVQKIEAKEFHP